MLKYFYRLQRKKGFTLVELIVVIAIVGVLAAILIPMVSSYVRKAQNANDKVMGKAIYQSVMGLITVDYEAMQSFHQITSGYKHFTLIEASEEGYNTNVNGWASASSKAKDGNYILVIVAKMDGRAGTIDKAAYAWQWGNKEGEPFINALNRNIGLTKPDNTLTDDAKKAQKNNQFMYNMMVSSHSDGYNTDRWLICFRRDDPSRIEICTGESYGKGRSGPRYRIYPNPCEEYS